MLSLAGTDDSLETIKTLIHEGNFDVTDAAAIALAGYIQEVNEDEVYKQQQQKETKAVKKRRVRRIKRSLRRSRSSNSKVRRNV
jgi:ribosomal protein L12E/L44/L45/RPP1/RPP2